MSKENLVEEAMLQMKQIEDLVAENAKGILASTMKEEINSLVQESLLSEQELEDDDDVMLEPDDSEVDAGVDLDVDTPEPEEVPDMGAEADDTNPVDMSDEEEDVLDLRDVDDGGTLLTVFKAMKDDDGIIVSKTGSDIHLNDQNTDNEYLIKLAESIRKNKLNESFYDLSDDEDDEWDDDSGDHDWSLPKDSGKYDDKMDFDDDESKDGWGFDEMDESHDDEGHHRGTNEKYFEFLKTIVDKHGIDSLSPEDRETYEFGMAHSDDDDMDYDLNEETEYEIDLNEYDDDEDNQYDDMMNYSIDELEDMVRELQHESRKRANEDYHLNEVKKNMTTKPKGVGMGSATKFKYKKKPNQDGGFDTKMKTGDKTKNTGKPKFEYKKGENMDGKMKKVSPNRGKTETKEAARTYAMGSKSNRGLRKGITPNRNNVYEAELKELRSKNQEYKNALNTFRDKLTEVAVFNSNLAYATRLFTEHSTTKKEKINILRRFDEVQTLKESKTLYNIIKNELGQDVVEPIKESVAAKINNTTATGSSMNLIESTTYESPQFLRMKDLMNKLK